MGRAAVSGRTAELSVTGCLSCADPAAGEVDFAPAISDRAAWGRLTGTGAGDLIADAETARTGDWPALSPALYARYARDGERVAFEAPYFERRRRLVALVLGELADGGGRFVAAIEAALGSICDEPGWQIPAHNSQERDGPVDPAPDPARPVVDLFAAETAATLGLAAALLARVLDPALIARIDREIDARVLTPYLARAFWWTGLQGGPMCNWTTWCTQNVLVAAFARPLAADRRRRIAARAATGLDIFLAEYGEDGACPEGPMYYGRAGLCLFAALDLLDRATRGALQPLFRDPKIRGIAEYILYAHIDGDLYANFSDAPARMPRPDARAFLFGAAVGSEDLMGFAAGAEGAPGFPAEISLFDRLTGLKAAEAMAAHPSVLPTQREGLLSSTGLFVARGGGLYLAVQAGHNGADHNHNDTGSVIVAKDGAPVLIDLGVGTYTAKTFSPARYEIPAMQSSWHNLPEFGGAMQHAGKAFAAREVRTGFDDKRAEIEMELSGAWGPEAGLDSFRRRAVLDRDSGTLEIRDRFRASTPAAFNYLVPVPPAGEGEALRVGPALLDFDGAARIETETVPLDDPRLQESWGAEITRLRVTPAADTLTLTIR